MHFTGDQIIAVMRCKILGASVAQCGVSPLAEEYCVDLHELTRKNKLACE